LLHDLADDASSDSWGLLPESFASIGYLTLAIDLPGYGGSLDARLDHRSAVEAATAWLRSQGAARLFVCAAGESVDSVPQTASNAIVLLAPIPAEDLAIRLGTTPRLIIGGIADPAERVRLEQFHAACRGWSPFTSYATDNTMTALLDGHHALQIRTQIGAFLQEFRGTKPVTMPIRHR